MRVTGRSVRPPPCRHATAVAARQFPSSSEEGSLRPPPKKVQSPHSRFCGNDAQGASSSIAGIVRNRLSFRAVL